MLISGTALSVIVRYQNLTPGYDNKLWRHPYFQSFVSGSGQLGGFLVHYINFRREKQRQIKHVTQERKSLAITNDMS